MTAKIKLNAASGGGSVSLEAPTSTTGNANVEFKLPLADGTSGQALTTNASGQLAFATVAVGGASNIAFNNGNGIDFSATSGTGTSELFDDYEEGNFTPTMRGNNTNTNITGTGKYTKIGRICHVQYAFLNKPSGDLPSGEYIQIHGLPFTSSGGTQVAHHGMNYKIGFNNSYQYYMYIPANGTIMWGYYNVNGGAYQAWGTDQWRQSSSNIYHETTFTYMVS